MLKRLAVIFVVAGVIICTITLLPLVKNILFTFIEAHIARQGKDKGGLFVSRLLSLLSLSFTGLIVFLFAFCCLFSKSFASFLREPKNDKLIFTITALLCMLFLGFCSIFSYKYGWQRLDSDHSSEMVLGKLLADENVFVSRNWHYSTELRLIYQTIFTMPLFKLFGHYEDWALIRALNILFNNILFIFSYLFMMKQLKVQTKYIMITSLFLITPITLEYWNIVIFGGYYIFFIAQVFIIIGLFLKLSGYNEKTKTATITFIFYTVLSFVLGVQGIRSLFSIFIPLFIACIYTKLKNDKKKNLPLFYGCYGLVLCGIGFAFNILLHFWYSFHSYKTMLLADLYNVFFLNLIKASSAFLNFSAFHLTTRFYLLGVYSVSLL